MKYKSIFLLLLWSPLMLHAQSHFVGYDEFVDKLRLLSKEMKATEHERIKKFMSSVTDKRLKDKKRNFKFMPVYELQSNDIVKNDNCYLNLGKGKFIVTSLVFDSLFYYLDVKTPIMPKIYAYDDSVTLEVNDGYIRYSEN